MKSGSTLAAVLRVAVWTWLALVVPPAMVLLVVAVTWPGRGWAVAVLLAGALPWLGLRIALHPHRAGRRWIVVAGVLWVALIVALLIRAPDGRTSPSARVQHVWAYDDVRFRRFAPGNVLPEVDQLMFGFTLVPLVDARFIQTQATALKTWTAAIYGELEADPEFSSLGSVLPLAMDELLGGRVDPGHALVYVPRGTRDQPRPLLVFLHGAGGNLKAYTWLLAGLADRLDIVVVAPSNGFGRWPEAEVDATVAVALAAAEGVAAIDRTRVHAMGLSNGGRAVSRLLGDARFRTLIFLSPVFAVDDRWPARPAGGPQPVLVLSGGRDDRVPAEYVDAQIGQLRRGGALVTARFVDDADHFLFFSHREFVLATLAAWVDSPGGSH